jgi:hypothetical protein
VIAIMTAVGKGYVAVLLSDMRGPMERRPAKTLREAFAAARVLLAVAEARKWYPGEAVSIRIEQAEE